jgi:integration host factor subunit beta
VPKYHRGVVKATAAFFFEIPLEKAIIIRYLAACLFSNGGPVTKSELIEVLARKANLTKKKSEELVNTIFDAFFQSMVKGDRIEIRGFGSWFVKNYKSYVGRNPKTGADVFVPEKKLPFFKVGKELKKRIDS